jgi:hypothetical protein
VALSWCAFKNLSRPSSFIVTFVFLWPQKVDSSFIVTFVFLWPQKVDSGKSNCGNKMWEWSEEQICRP